MVLSKNKRIDIRLSESESRALDNFSAKHGISKSDIIRNSLDVYVQNYEKLHKTSEESYLSAAKVVDEALDLYVQENY